MTNLSIRPLAAEDIPSIVEYWLENSDADLIRMGADKTKLESAIEFAHSLQTICNTPLSQAKSYYMIWLIDGKPIGYNALKDIMHDKIASMHLHIWNPEYQGKGYGPRLFCMAALEFYKMFNLKMILCEPRASNPFPNKMLTKIGFSQWKAYVTTPSEIALTCEINSYLIDPITATNFLKNAGASASDLVSY